MASQALTEHFDALLEDADHLVAARKQLPRGSRSLALNRAVVIMCVSAWEAYIEELMRECLDHLRPPAPPLGVWPALNATVRGQLGRFHTPNMENVRMLFSDALGLPDIQSSWTWQNCTSNQAVQRLADAMTLRHQIAHGVNPRPVVGTWYSMQLPEFFRRLGHCTDRAVRDRLVHTLGIAIPWPQ
jgi:hypothetical protein